MATLGNLLLRASQTLVLRANAETAPAAATSVEVQITESGGSVNDLRVIVVMGVAASGKSSVGGALAQALGWPFFDGDDFHSDANKAKMQSGVPLTDDDRRPWLATLRSLVGDVIQRDGHAVLACSALKASYRDAIVPAEAPPGAVRFVFLDVPRAELLARLTHRRHFFPPSLLDSQLDTLEAPRGAVRVDGTRPIPEIVSIIRDALRA
jgi:gluconokinase